MGEIMGRGGFSVVRRGTKKSDNLSVAIKSLDKRGKYGESTALIRNEIAVMALILEKVHHPNVVRRGAAACRAGYFWAAQPFCFPISGTPGPPLPHLPPLMLASVPSDGGGGLARLPCCFSIH